MKHNLVILFIILSIITSATYKLVSFFYLLEKHSFPPQKNNTKDKIKKETPYKKNILLVNDSHAAFGGAEMYTLSLYQNLLKNGYNVKILIVKHSNLEDKLKECKLSYFAYNKFMLFKNAIQPGLNSAISKVCKKHNVQIIHCNGHREARAAKKIAKTQELKVVMTRHIPQKINPKHLEGLDGIIGVSPQITQYIETENQSLNHKIKNIIFIPPFFEEEKYLTFKPSTNKQDFFEKNFDIKLSQKEPSVCMIAHITENKNHQILLHAAANLIHKKHKPLHFVFAGDGPLKKQLEELALKLNIKNYVHFLGYTNQVPEILYQSDIKILTSKTEGLPIVLLEAATLEKPLIAPKGNNAENVVLHKTTGLLFEQDNIQDLTNQIENLLNSKALRTKFGNNAQKLVLQNFTTKKNMGKLEKFYARTLVNNEHEDQLNP